jgi:transposase-like protein
LPGKLAPMKSTNPTTILDFQRRFDTEEACEAVLFRWRWPDGFRCPRCGGEEATRLATRRQYQCKSCRHQVSITAGTAMHKTKLPLLVWFWAIFLVARHKKSISALQLQSDLGLGSYKTAWLLLHKIRACFDESSAFPLLGLVEVDEAYVGGTEKGVRPGRAASKKGIVVTAVEVLPNGRLGSARMKVIPDVKTESLVPFVEESVAPDATVATDGWPAFNELDRIGYRRERHVCKGPRNAAFHPVLNGVHLMISNLKTWLRGQFHGVSRKYLPAYVAEFLYRFNRRRSPPDLFGWVARRLMSRDALTFDALTAVADVCR